MPDPLYLSLWFPSFEETDILPRVLSVMRQFPFSATRPGVGYLALQPVSWNEPTILERKFQPGIAPEEAVLIASDLLHDDYAYVFEAYWDLWTAAEHAGNVQWSFQPRQVRFIAQGTEFNDGDAEHTGHIEIDFGMDTPFLHEELSLTEQAEAHVRANVQKLVDFTLKLEQSSGASGRLLWSESEDNLAQKLIARLQRVQ